MSVEPLSACHTICEEISRVTLSSELHDNAKLRRFILNWRLCSGSFGNLRDAFAGLCATATSVPAMPQFDLVCASLCEVHDVGQGISEMSTIRALLEGCVVAEDLKRSMDSLSLALEDLVVQVDSYPLRDTHWSAVKHFPAALRLSIATIAPDVCSSELHAALSILQESTRESEQFNKDEVLVVLSKWGALRPERDIDTLQDALAQVKQGLERAEASLHSSVLRDTCRSNLDLVCDTLEEAIRETLENGMQNKQSTHTRRPAAVSYAAAPSEFYCPISLCIMKEPVIIESGWTYDRASIQDWFRLGYQECPVTRIPVKNRSLMMPNRALKKMIEDYLTQNPDAAKDVREEEEDTASEALPSEPSDLMLCPVSRLTTFLRDNQVPYGHCLEKADLVRLCTAVQTGRRAVVNPVPHTPTPGPPTTTSSDPPGTHDGNQDSPTSSHHHEHRESSSTGDCTAAQDGNGVCGGVPMPEGFGSGQWCHAAEDEAPVASESGSGWQGSMDSACSRGLETGGSQDASKAAQDRIRFDSLSIPTLKAMLRQRAIPCEHCLEKGELVALCEEVADVLGGVTVSSDSHSPGDSNSSAGETHGIANRDHSHPDTSYSYCAAADGGIGVRPDGGIGVQGRTERPSTSYSYTGGVNGTPIRDRVWPDRAYGSAGQNDGNGVRSSPRPAHYRSATETGGRGVGNARALATRHCYSMDFDGRGVTPTNQSYVVGADGTGACDTASPDMSHTADGDSHAYDADDAGVLGRPRPDTTYSYQTCDGNGSGSEAFAGWSVSHLKTYLTSHGVATDGIVEKRELVALCAKIAEVPTTATAPAPAPVKSKSNLFSRVRRALMRSKKKSP